MFAAGGSFEPACYVQRQTDLRIPAIQPQCFDPKVCNTVERFSTPAQFAESSDQPLPAVAFTPEIQLSTFSNLLLPDCRTGCVSQFSESSRPGVGSLPR